MDSKKKKILYLTGGVMTTGVLVTTIFLIRRRNKKKRELMTSGSSSISSANLLTTNNNQLPTNFRNWNGGSTYLTNSQRGIRNNNPGNLVATSIKWQGKIPKEQNKDRRFEMFIAPEYGVRAMIKDLKNDIIKGKSTVPLLVSEYSPRFENNTDAYIQTVCKGLNVSKTAVLLPTKNTLRLLVLTMTKVETGGDYVTNALFEKAYSMI